MAFAIDNNQHSPHKDWFEWLPVLLGLMVLYTPTFYNLANGIWQEDEYAHGPIILLVVIWLFWDERQTLVSTKSLPAITPGIAILLVGLVLNILGRLFDIRVLEIGALIPILAGSLIAMRGWPALRIYWFALLFVVYLVPLPGIFVDAITGPLKQHISSIAEQILYTLGYPIARSGVVLTIGQYQLLVADACSGINSMFSLSALGLLYLYLTQRQSLLHNCIVVASLLPIAFCANVIRVMFLVLVTYHLGDAAGQGFLHKFSGMVLFVAALAFIITLDALLVRIIKPRQAHKAE